MAILSWFLYLSLTLRNTWMNFILDRYFHYTLFYAMFLPLDRCWSIQQSNRTTTTNNNNHWVVSAASIALKLQVTWIYLDAGAGKYMDPLEGWTYHADPLPALDTYARHTVVARYLYALLRPEGLRLLTPTVVWVELLAAPITLLCSCMGWKRLVYASIAIVCSLHIGIALTVRNTVLLSLVACCAWMPFLPQDNGLILNTSTVSNSHGGGDSVTTQGVRKTDSAIPGSEQVSSTSKTDSQNPTPPRPTNESTMFQIVSFFIIICFIGGSVWFETMSGQCDQSMEHIWSTLLHNRWNVFVGAEEYVTWEIAPGRLADGSVVDVWGRTRSVNWNLPGGGAPSTSTARPGRWRSFPYLAGLEGDAGKVLWDYLCKQWDREHDAILDPGQKLLRYNFFMLQADVLPNMGFSSTRKRLIHAHECPMGSTNGRDRPDDDDGPEHGQAAMNATSERTADEGEQDRQETVDQPDL